MSTNRETAEPHDIHPGVPCRVPGCPGPNAARAAQDVAGRETYPDPYPAAEEVAKWKPRGQDVTPPPDALREAWGSMLEDIMGLWGVADPDLDDVLETLSDHKPHIEAALRAQGVVQSPERCLSCDHIEDEHRTPGGECVHAHCSCDQLWLNLERIFRAGLAAGKTWDGA